MDGNFKIIEKQSYYYYYFELEILRVWDGVCGGGVFKEQMSQTFRDRYTFNSFLFYFFVSLSWIRKI